MDMKMGLSALKSFYIMQILLERTDEAHSLNAIQIMDILENVYGVKIDRHTLYKAKQQSTTSIGVTAPHGCG